MRTGHSHGNMESEEARDLRIAITLLYSANPSGNRNLLSEVWGGFQEARSQGVQAHAKAIGVSLNPDAALHTHTCYPSTREAEAGESYV